MMAQTYGGFFTQKIDLYTQKQDAFVHRLYRCFYLLSPRGSLSLNYAFKYMWWFLYQEKFQYTNFGSWWRWWYYQNSPGFQSYSQMMISMSNHLLSIVFRFHYHSQKVIGSITFFPLTKNKQNTSVVKCLAFKSFLVQFLQGTPKTRVAGASKEEGAGSI